MAKIYRLPARAGASVAVLAALILAVMSTFAVHITVWTVAGVAVLIGAAGYVVMRVLVVGRLQKLEELLKSIEERTFEEVEEPAGSGGDELTRLDRLARRSGSSVMEEMGEMKRTESHRRDFIGNVSHELKTPIFAIRGFAETLLGGALEDQSVKRSFLEKILRNALRLENLARDLSDITRIETGELKMVIAPFRLETVIREVVESLEQRAHQKSIAIECIIPQTLPQASGDEERIRQVLANLIDNAVKYSNEGGRVEVVARFAEPASIKVSVVDGGIGVSSEHIRRLTERFYRVDKSRSRSQGGTGLGLSIVKHILAAHGRRLQVHSVAGSGSTFGFSIDAVVSTPVEEDLEFAALSA